MGDISDSLKKKCYFCRGEGVIESKQRCGKCMGLGGRLDKGPDPLGSISIRCLECGGTGEIITEKKCISCGGLGWVY